MTYEEMKKILEETVKISRDNTISMQKTDKRINKLEKVMNGMGLANDKISKNVNKLEKVMNGIGLTQGDISEEIIADNFGNVFRKVGEYISSIERNLKIYKNNRVKGEFDIIGVNGSKVFIGETKTKLTKKHIDKLVNTTIPNFKKYDNRHDGMEVFGVIGTRVFANEKVLDYAIEKGLYVIKETHNGNAKILKESLKAVKSF